MQFLITFLEGVISFISPCMLPMLPLYISYFAGKSDDKHKPLPRAIGFVIGFTVVFTLLGLLAGTLSVFLTKYRIVVNIISGLLVIVFGLSYLEIIRIPFFKGMSGKVEIKSVFSAFLFGVVYAVGLTPCVGAFLGSALMMASTSGGVIKGMLLLLTYSLGMGIPFLLSAVLIDKLSSTFSFIKRHYKVINTVCGIFLIVIGVMMMFGLMSAVLSMFS
ncbi:MAG: cytochrome c biogenesis protein CcdA [Clostridiales bacterium]|nr:cytochrome c biogenesis protein CcdA [Clostridiales bacterium]